MDMLKAWLQGKGFTVGNPRLLIPAEARRYGGGNNSTYTLVSSWDVKKNGTIFAHGLLERLGSFFVYGVDVAVTYGGKFEIYEVSIYKTSE